MNWVRVVIGTATMVVPVTWTALDLVGHIAQVHGISMQPELNPVHTSGRFQHDWVFLNRWAACTYKFQRGEIVSLASPNNPDRKLIKRIIALEGDIVRTLSYKEPDVLIPEGYCWLEGDCQTHSLDSNIFGPVPLGLIESKASHIVYPVSRWRKLQPVQPNKNRFLDER